MQQAVIHGIQMQSVFAYVLSVIITSRHWQKSDFSKRKYFTLHALNMIRMKMIARDFQSHANELTLYHLETRKVRIMSPPAPWPRWLSWLSMNTTEFCLCNMPQPSWKLLNHRSSLLPRKASPRYLPYLNSVTRPLPVYSVPLMGSLPAVDE